MSAEKGNLYRETILRLARDTAHVGSLEAPTHVGKAHNPLCGDELKLSLAMENDVIAAVKVLTRGCVISQAAAAMMAQAVKGQTLAHAEQMGREFAMVMEEEDGALPAALASLRPLLEVRNHRSRIRCVLLPWDSLASIRPV